MEATMSRAARQQIDDRIAQYFIGRALEILEQAKRAEGEERYELELRCSAYWKIARADDRD
jgi:hypothetical protein